MLRDELVEIFGAKFACVDKGFGNNKPVDVVIRPEDIDLVEPSEGTLVGTCHAPDLQGSSLRDGSYHPGRL